jgi:glutaconate CoA-transferase subunit A
MPLEDVLSTLSDGDLIAFGGGGLDRKPMAAAKAIGRSPLKNLRIVTYFGGPEVDLLIGLGKIESVHFAYIGLDNLGMAPNFRRAREVGAIEAIEASEYMIIAGLEAKIRGIPFMPTRSGIGADLLRLENTPFRTFRCPLTDEELVAVPALAPGVVFIHANEADAAGNARILGDAFVDHLLARAGARVFVTSDTVVERLDNNSHTEATFISRLWVTGVCQTSNGTGFTRCYPDRMLDAAAAWEYATKAGHEAWLKTFVIEA